MLDLVHALADTDGGCEMENGVDALERAANGGAIAHVADEQLDVHGEILRAPAVLSVDLRRQAIERAHRVAAREQLVGKMGPYETGSAGNQDSLRRHLPSAGRPSR